MALPSKTEILDWIAAHPAESGKRDIARAFGVKGALRTDLKRLLRELEDEGHLSRRKKTYREPGTLPPVTVLTVRATPDGDLMGEPMEWRGEADAPTILIHPREGEAPGDGERVLARLQRLEGADTDYDARIIRRIGTNPRRVLGVFRKGAEGGRIVPIDKGSEKEWRVRDGDAAGARDGELVEAEQSGPRRMGLPQARVTDRLGDPSAPRAVSLIAIHQHGIPDSFPDEAVAEADAARPVQLGEREDLRDLPLLTIDPADARDHDDAVWATPDDEPGNEGGHVLWVAIADVAHYVTPGTALDAEARRRGNSTYFPDRVVPMLPDVLSGDLCSLHEGVDRPVIAVRIRLAPDGEKLDHRFARALMRSAASLPYEEVQAAMDGDVSGRIAPLMAEAIDPLYAAFRALQAARRRREPLDLDLPERRIVLSDEGEVTSVAEKERLDAHRLIEEFMVLANVCAAETLEAKRTPLVYRVHEEPSPEKLDALREVAEASGLSLAKGQVLRTRHLNRLLAQAEEAEVGELVSLATLRSMQQAYYSPRNFGHFGLALRRYAHFTSPIRRYADLLVHRALIRAHGWGPDPKADGLTPEEEEGLDAAAEHISGTERRSMLAERDTNDRYLAAFLADRVGSTFEGRVSGVQRFGLFVKLDETGADGLIPVRALGGGEYWRFDEDEQTLTGSESGTAVGLGDRVTVKLVEAAPLTGGLILEPVEIAGRARRPDPRPARRGGPRRAKGKAAAKARKSRKVARRRR
ncbi:RNAse R [Hasllibacter halocynthiae]|uniref:Ribonuclease R n=1 Tax=Hasllibacter halocynthiae TaxID=595589 RepID=A0A2T0X1N2_9RHOB|nr:ribonuclease R [Hasllibacter halocynthiae]PRY92852.1 RNAse R [Hasllibacter halocynthiae]